MQRVTVGTHIYEKHVNKMLNIFSITNMGQFVCLKNNEVV